jgi:hypothetical protein
MMMDPRRNCGNPRGCGGRKKIIRSEKMETEIEIILNGEKLYSKILHVHLSLRSPPY